MKNPSAPFWFGWIGAHLSATLSLGLVPVKDGVSIMEWSACQTVASIVALGLLWALILAVRVLPRYRVRIERVEKGERDGR